MAGVAEPLRGAFVAYLHRKSATCTQDRVQPRHPAGRVRPVPRRDRPDLASLAELDRRRHIEPFLTSLTSRHQHAHRRADHRRRSGPTRASPSATSSPTSPNGDGPTPRRGGCCSAPTCRGCPARCPATCPSDADRRLAQAAAPARPTGCRRRAAAATRVRAAHRRAARPGTGLRARDPRAGRLAEGAAGQAGHRTDGAARRRDPRPCSTGSSRPAHPAGRCRTRAPAGPPSSCSPTTDAGSRRTRCATNSTAPPPRPAWASHPAPTSAHLRHRPGQRRGVAAGADGPARALCG